MKKTLTLEETEKLNLSKVKELYNRFVNPYQTKILSNFPFGSEIYERAEGMYIYTKEGKISVASVTAGIGFGF